MVLNNDLVEAIKNVVIIFGGVYLAAVYIRKFQNYIEGRRWRRKDASRSLHLENAYKRMNSPDLSIQFLPVDIDNNGLTFQITTKCENPVFIATIFITWSQLTLVAPLK